MHPDQFEAEMRKFEYFHSLRIIPKAFPIIRVDGRGFSKLTKDLTKPFDNAFHHCMVQTTQELVREFGAIYGYTESDEISILLPRNSNLFDREVEKLISISASVATAQFNATKNSFVGPVGQLPDGHFDSRIFVAPDVATVRDYFSWRQADSARNCLNSATFWALVQSGKSHRAAAKAMHQANQEKNNEILHSLGVNFAALPGWQRNGTGVYYKTVDKGSFNLKTDEWTIVKRRAMEVDENLLYRDEYRNFVENLIVEREAYEKSDNISVESE